MKAIRVNQVGVSSQVGEHPGEVRWVMSVEDFYGPELESIFLTWLKAMGLAFDPFVILDAGADPDIPAYLVSHGDFEKLWGDWPAFIFAPAGGGKTAFRVRLARACRMNEDGRRIFPIIYHRLPAPDEIHKVRGQDVHLKNITRQAAQELLFLLAYRPLELSKLDEATLIAMRQVLDMNLPSPLDDYLTRLYYFGSLSPLTQEFDRAASHLINPPGPEDLRPFCERLARIPSQPISNQSPAQRFDDLTRLLLGPLHFEAVYLLVDGVDAYPETVRDPAAALSVLRWLLDNTPSWTEQRIYAKFFLPTELESVLLQKMPDLLTTPIKVAIIRWSADDLVEVVRRRLNVASEGMFDSLDAISSPGLHDVEATLARTVRPCVPREMLVLTERLLAEHVQRSGARGKLEPQDLKLACHWYAARVAQPT